MKNVKKPEQCNSVYWNGKVGPFRCKRESGHDGKHQIIPGVHWTTEEAVPLKKD